MLDKRVVESYMNITGCTFKELCDYLEDTKFLEATRSVQGAVFLKLHMQGYSWATIGEGRDMNGATVRYTANRTLNYIKEQREIRLKLQAANQEPTPEETEQKRKYKDYLRFLMRLCEFKDNTVTTSAQ